MINHGLDKGPIVKYDLFKLRAGNSIVIAGGKKAVIKKLKRGIDKKQGGFLFEIQLFGQSGVTTYGLFYPLPLFKGNLNQPLQSRLKRLYDRGWYRHEFGSVTI